VIESGDGEVVACAACTIAAGVSAAEIRKFCEQVISTDDVACRAPARGSTKPASKVPRPSWDKWVRLNYLASLSSPSLSSHVWRFNLIHYRIRIVGQFEILAVTAVAECTTGPEPSQIGALSTNRARRNIRM
jgi:hypothetical protein